jgi:hypothetical protein
VHQQKEKGSYMPCRSSCWPGYVQKESVVCQSRTPVEIMLMIMRPFKLVHMLLVMPLIQLLIRLLPLLLIQFFLVQLVRGCW